MVPGLLYALPMALLWVVIVGQATLEVFMVGLLAGIALVIALRPPAFAVRWSRLPGQLLALCLYVLFLFRDIFFSGLDVARRVLARDMRLQPGIIAVATGDRERSPVILALSADYISLTPGELVVEVADNHLMYVHCLDVVASAAIAEAAQAQRLRLLERVMGREA
ncbi:MAG: Na+/H+ antiporter subunit E [Anaerolineae bacterium]|jgi:multisubunit Na+/H+ antiporter MnhE subunit|nr:Na+/H+ antiporter subunit E [Anaerolineae bacterium]